MSVDDIYDTWLLTNASSIRFDAFSYEFGDGYDAAEQCDEFGDASPDNYGKAIKHRLIMQLLSDYDLDGKVTHADGGMKSGLQVSNAFKEAVAKLRFDRSMGASDLSHRNISYKVDREQRALCNMVNYMSKRFVEQ